MTEPRPCTGMAQVNDGLVLTCDLPEHRGAHHDRLHGYQWYDPWRYPGHPGEER